MSLSREFTFLPPGSITFERKDRQRTGITTEGLLESIKSQGIMNPLIVTRDHELIAGERRLTAALELKLPEVPVRYVDTLSPTQSQLLELDENLKRQNLSWQDTTNAIGRIHGLLLAADPDWTMGETGAYIGVSQATVSKYLAVHPHMGEDLIFNAGTFGEAFNILQRRKQRAQGAELEELLGGSNLPPAPPPAPLPATEAINTPGVSIPAFDAGLPGVASPPVELPYPVESSLLRQKVEQGEAPTKPEPLPSILVADFLQWAPLYDGPKFNLLHCDFPYGVNLFNGPQAGGRAHGQYDDGEDVYFNLIRCLCANLDRLMSVSSHVVFRFSEKHRTKTLELFAELAPSIVWAPYPLVWWKTDNAGIAGDVKRHPRHVYETALFGSRGGRNLVKVKADCYGAPTDKKWHPSTKPEPMLRHFFEMMVDQGTELLDPTCGGGSALRAAESMGARRVLGLEQDPDFANQAATALHQARSLRTLGG